MTVISIKDFCAKKVDRLFGQIKVEWGDTVSNPITEARFVWGEDPVEPQKRIARLAFLARAHFAQNGPAHAPPLPLSHDDWEQARRARGLRGLVGFFARSLAGQDWDFEKHPSFEDFARGLMATGTGLWEIEEDEYLRNRFPPCALPGMTPGAVWAPPQE
jgi:hypothetical protein